MGVVPVQHRGTAAARTGRAFKTLCAACRSSDAGLNVTPELVSLILSGTPPREAFLLGGHFISSGSQAAVYGPSR